MFIRFPYTFKEKLNGINIRLNNINKINLLDFVISTRSILRSIIMWCQQCAEYTHAHRKIHIIYFHYDNFLRHILARKDFNSFQPKFQVLCLNPLCCIPIKWLPKLNLMCCTPKTAKTCQYLPTSWLEGSFLNWTQV